MDNCPSCLMLKEVSGNLKEYLAKPLYCRACYQRERIKTEQLQAENKELEADGDAHSRVRQRHLVRLGNCSDKIEQLQVKYKKLKEKAKIIKVGNVPAPDFNPDMGLGKNVKFSLHDPETAYLWGWEGAIFECGEILSKP